MVVVAVNTPSDKHTSNDDLELTVLLAALIRYLNAQRILQEQTQDELVRGTAEQHRWVATGLAYRVGEVLNLSVIDVLELIERERERRK